VERPLRAIIEDRRLTAYELDSCARLTQFAADLAAALPMGPRIAVRLVVPHVQYHCYLAQLLDRGLIDVELLVLWFELVNRRRERIVAHYRGELERALAGVGEDRVTFNVAPSLDVLAPEICAAVRAGRTPDAGDLAARMAQEDELWRRVCEVEKPSDLVGLSCLSFALEYLDSALSPRPACKRLTIAVDDPKERKIYERAVRVGKKLRRRDARLQAALLGLYPLRRAIATGRYSSLYYSDPGQRLVDDAGRARAPGELVECLYNGRAGAQPRA
jgi:hypothetical protein